MDNASYFMLDLETTSLRSNAGILQIGAWAFSYTDDDSGELEWGPLEDHPQAFHMNVDSSGYAPDLHSDPKTMAWWAEQSPEAQAALLTDRRPLPEALHEFIAWMDGFGPVQNRVVCGHVDFDHPIITNAMRVVDIEPGRAWDFRTGRFDLRSLFMATSLRPSGPQLGESAHIAVYDAWRMACQMQEVMQATLVEPAIP